MRAIGIDLGTTNSVVAVGGDTPRVLVNRDNEPLTPSAVSYMKRRRAANGEFIVGRQALNNAVRDPENTILSVKRLMGLPRNDPKASQIADRLGIQFAGEDRESEDGSVLLLIGGEAMTPTRISSMILSRLKSDAEAALGEAVSHAVITVPAYFTERQRNATAKAGELAGLSVLKVLDEPTAAAIAFGASREEERHRLLIYDLGGGTFDISIIQATKGEFQVLQTDGDNWLGGDDFDLTIVRRMLDWVKGEYDYDASKDPVFLAKARMEARQAKMALSTQSSFELFAPILKLPDEPLKDVDMEIELSQFEEDINPYVERTIKLMQRALSEQQLTPDLITQVLLVGGSTAVPLVQRSVSIVFDEGRVKRNIEPMQCVALGAAIVADRFDLSEYTVAPVPKTEDFLVEVTPMHLGIGAVQGKEQDRFVPIIEKNTPYPLKEPRRKTFYPSEPNQRLLRIPVFEGLNDIASLNEQQGILECPLQEGVSQDTSIEVAFNYDHNRVLTVSVRIPKTGETFKEVLKRGMMAFPALSDDDTVVGDWREKLQSSIEDAQDFVRQYREFAKEEDIAEINEAITKGEEALRTADKETGQHCTLILTNKIMSSGIASNLFMAETVMGWVSGDEARTLSQAVNEIRRAYHRGDNVKVLIDALVPHVSQIIQKHDRTDFRAAPSQNQLRFNAVPSQEAE